MCRSIYEVGCSVCVCVLTLCVCVEGVARGGGACVHVCLQSFSRWRHYIGQQSPTFLAPRPSFVEDKFSIDMVGGMISG